MSIRDIYLLSSIARAVRSARAGSGGLTAALAAAATIERRVVGEHERRLLDQIVAAKDGDTVVVRRGDASLARAIATHLFRSVTLQEE